MWMCALAFALTAAVGCTNGQYDPSKGDAFVRATTNPAITVGAPTIATAVGGPAAGAGTLAIVTAVGAIAAAVVSVLNNRHASNTSSTVNDVATMVTDIATAVNKGVTAPKL